MAEHPQPGDRTARDDDRYLFLEALLAAREHLIITYVGQSISDNSELPPSVVVSELLDAVDRTFVCLAGPRCRGRGSASRVASGARSARALSRRSRVRASASSSAMRCSRSARTTSGAIRERRAFSYAATHYAGARRPGRSAQLPAAGRSPCRSPAEPIESVTLDELVRFFENPSRWFLQRGSASTSAATPSCSRTASRSSSMRSTAGASATSCSAARCAAATRPRRGPCGAPAARCRSARPGAARSTRSCRGAAALARRAAPRCAAAIACRRETIDLSVDGVRLTGVAARALAGRADRRAVLQARRPPRARPVDPPSGAPRRGAATARAERAGRRDAQRARTCARRWFSPVPDPLRLLAELLRLFRLGQRAPLPFFRRRLARLRRGAGQSRAARRSGAWSERAQGVRAEPRTGRPGDADDPYVAELYPRRAAVRATAAGVLPRDLVRRCGTGGLHPVLRPPRAAHMKELDPVRDPARRRAPHRGQRRHRQDLSRSPRSICACCSSAGSRSAGSSSSPTPTPPPRSCAAGCARASPTCSLRCAATATAPMRPSPSWLRRRRAAGSVAADCQRLEAALYGFDEAAIFTIHGFCQRDAAGARVRERRGVRCRADRRRATADRRGGARLLDARALRRAARAGARARGGQVSIASLARLAAHHGRAPRPARSCPNGPQVDLAAAIASGTAVREALTAAAACSCRSTSPPMPRASGADARRRATRSRSTICCSASTGALRGTGGADALATRIRARFPGRADRRVPGHRPGAVAHLRAHLPRRRAPRCS